jgi:hypothetical protein
LSLSRSKDCQRVRSIHGRSRFGHLCRLCRGGKAGKSLADLLSPIRSGIQR